MTCLARPALSRVVLNPCMACHSRQTIHHRQCREWPNEAVRSAGGARVAITSRKTSADALGGYPFRTHKTCFPAKAGIQWAPAFAGEQEGASDRRTGVDQSLVMLFWTEPMMDRLATVTRHAGMENHAR